MIAPGIGIAATPECFAMHRSIEESHKYLLSGVGVDCTEIVGKYTFFHAIDSDPMLKRCTKLLRSYAIFNKLLDIFEILNYVLLYFPIHFTAVSVLLTVLRRSYGNRL
ncbi:MAG: hypothetical protein ABW168_16660 [Sedimenticola sp.]